MSPLGSQIKRGKVLDDETRAKIYTRINSNQGASFTELRALLDYFDFLEIRKNTLRHHLDILEENEFIKSRWDGYRIFFYTADFKIPAEPRLSKAKEEILYAIGLKPRASQEELAADLGYSVSTISYHLKYLVGRGLARVEKHGKRNEVYKVE